jgi:hypothetical protein
MPRYSYEPQSDIGFKTAQTGLSKWLERQRQSREQFTSAEAPLRKAVTSFQPGGGYGRGQKTLLREKARQAGAEATAQQVASGMSSGSLATGTGLRIKRDLATAEAGVEDQRVAFLNQVLSQMSGLRGQQASITAQTADPTLAPMLGYLSSRFGQVAGMNTGAGPTYGQRRPLPTLAGSQLAGSQAAGQFALPGFVR